MKTRSPTTIGLLFPGCGSFAFHLMFLSLFHSSGTLVSLDRPSRPGPRKDGQSAARIVDPTKRTKPIPKAHLAADMDVCSLCVEARRTGTNLEACACL